MLFDMIIPSPASLSDFVANFENNIGIVYVFEVYKLKKTNSK